MFAGTGLWKHACGPCERRRFLAIVDLGLSFFVDEETSAAGMATAVDGELLASLLDIAILR